MMGVISQRVGDGTHLNGDACSVLAEPMEFLFLADERLRKSIGKNTARKRPAAETR
jgi:GntR family transcriptional repressor for pyruvate dehydrogenase complex